MAKSKKIKLPKEITDELGVSEDIINDKLQQVVDRRDFTKGIGNFEYADIVRDYDSIFTKNELIALFIHAASNAGFYEWKLMELIEKCNIPMEVITEILASTPSSEDISNRVLPSNEDDDFI